MRYNETDFGTTGGYINSNSLGTYYNQTAYNTGSNIKRGAARFVYMSDTRVKNIDDRHVFYTYNHYNDFEEYLNYHNGWGVRFGNESAGNEYCGGREDFYNLNCVSPTEYPLVLFKKYNEIMKARATLDKSGKVSSGGETSANADFQTATSQGISSNADGVPTQLRASGDAYFRNDEVALVGESPNAELVLGSNLNRSVNSGTLVHLAKGSGVVNAESTATLAGLLNSIEPQKNDSFGRSVQQVFSFSNLTLPNVTDAESFVNTLSHKFNNYAIQYGNSRK
jgi:hypothetical protein